MKDYKIIHIQSKIMKMKVFKLIALRIANKKIFNTNEKIDNTNRTYHAIFDMSC